ATRTKIGSQCSLTGSGLATVRTSYPLEDTCNLRAGVRTGPDPGDGNGAQPHPSACSRAARGRRCLRSPGPGTNHRMAEWNDGAQPGSDLHLWESQWASIEEDADGDP